MPGQFEKKFTLPDISIPVESVATTAVGAISDGFMLDTHLGQFIQKAEVDALVGNRNVDIDPNYNAFRDPRIRMQNIDPSLYDDMADVNSYEEFLSVQEMSRLNSQREARLQDHGIARFMAGFADPYNFIPIPLARGRGFLQGFKRTLLPNAAIVTAAESGRTSLDPNDTVAQTALNISMGTLLASGIGGAFGMLPVTPRSVAAATDAVNMMHDHVEAGGSKRGASVSEMKYSDERHQRNKSRLPEGTTKEDVIRGTASDGLPDDVMRFQALRDAGEDFGRRIVIRKDEKAGDFVMTVNDKETLRGTKRELVKEAEGLGVDRVKNFSSREALDQGETKFTDRYPEAPDKVTEPEKFQQYEDDELPFNAERDEDGVRYSSHNAHKNRSTMRESMDSDLLAANDRMAENDATLSRMEADQAILKKKLKHRNQHSEPKEKIQADLDKVTLDMGKLRAVQRRFGEARDDLENRIDLAEQSNDPVDFMFKPTGIGLENLFARSGQFPFFGLVNNKLIDLAPDLAADWQKIAYRLSGSPGLMFKGGAKGVGVGTSAEMQATQWWHTFRQAKVATDSNYAKLYGYGDSIGPTQQTLMEAKDDVVRLARLKNRDIDATGEGLSFHEFRIEISRALINKGKITEERAKLWDKDTVTAIENSATEWRGFFDKFKNDAEQLGVFQTQRSLAGNIRKNKEYIDSIQGEIDDITSGAVSARQPFSDIQVDVRYKRITEDIKDPDPMTGEVVAAFRRTETMPDGTTREVIYIDREGIQAGFDRKAWRTPRERVDGGKIFPLDFDFETPKQWEQFVLAHEKAHVKFKKRKGQSTADYENQTNSRALKEIDRLKESKGSNLEKKLIESKQKYLDKKLLELDMLEQQADIQKGLKEGGDWLDADYLYRIWLPDEIKNNEAMFKGILFAHFEANPHIWKHGKRKKLSTDKADIEVRVNEAYDNIVRESEFDDPFFMVDPAARRAQVRGRLEELNAERNASDFDPKSVEAKSLNRKIKLYEEALDKPDFLATMMPQPLRSRALDINNSKVADFIELDIEHIAQRYLQKVAPVIETTRNFGDKSLSDFRIPLNRALDERIINARENGDEALAKALETEQISLNQSVDNLRDMVLGVYGMSKNPAHWTGRTVRLSMAWMNLVSMGKAVMVALNDFGNYVGYVGFKRAFGDTWRFSLARARKDRSEWNLARDEVLAAGEASQIWSAQRAIALTDIGGMRGMNRFERGVQKNQQRMFIVNLLTPWTDFMEGLTGSMAQHAIIRDAVAMTKGTLSASRLTELTKLGMTRHMARKISENWHRVPEADRQGRHIFLANSHMWDDPVTERAFRAMLATEIANLVPAPRSADKPAFMHKDWGRMMFQYKGFSFAATSRILMANLQRRDQRALSTMTAMIGMSFLIDMLKRPDFIDMDLDDALFRAVEISGVGGILTDANQMIEGATGGEMGMRPMLGLKSMERDVSVQTRFGSVAGAVPNLVTSFGSAFLSDDADTADKARALRYMIPYNNLLYWSGIVDRMQRGIVDTLE